MHSLAEEIRECVWRLS
jgi:hypothetical protein